MAHITFRSGICCAVRSLSQYICRNMCHIATQSSFSNWFQASVWQIVVSKSLKNCLVLVHCGLEHQENFRLPRNFTHLLFTVAQIMIQIWISFLHICADAEIMSSYVNTKVVSIDLESYRLFSKRLKQLN